MLVLGSARLDRLSQVAANVGATESSAASAKRKMVISLREPSPMNIMTAGRAEWPVRELSMPLSLGESISLSTGCTAPFAAAHACNIVQCGVDPIFHSRAHGQHRCRVTIPLM